METEIEFFGTFHPCEPTLALGCNLDSLSHAQGFNLQDKEETSPGMDGKDGKAKIDSSIHDSQRRENPKGNKEIWESREMS